LGIEYFSEELKRSVQGRKVAVFSHPRVDPDGFAAALVSSYMLNYLGALASYAYLDDMNSLAKRMNEKYRPPAPPADFFPDIALIVDACGLNYSHRGKEFHGSEAFVIDHHQCGSISSSKSFVDAHASSSCELILKISSYLGFALTPDMATALLAGLLFDTAIFKYASSESVISAAELINIGGDYQTALTFSKRELTKSLRMAKLKAAKSIELLDSGDLVIAFTTTDIFEGEIAEALLNLGADIAFVAAPRGKGVRVSGRADEKAVSSGINLANFFKESGGGHEGAAGAYIEGSIENVMKEIKTRLVARL